MAWVTPPDFANGQVVTESQLDILSGDLNDLNARVAVPKVLVKQNAAQTIGTGTDVILNWHVEDLDTHNMWDASGTTTVKQQLLIPETGAYFVGCRMALQNNGTGDERLLYITKNSVSPTQTATIAYGASWPGIQPGGGCPIIAVNLAYLNTGDILRTLCFQDSGGNLSTQLTVAGVGTFYAVKVPGT